MAQLAAAVAPAIFGGISSIVGGVQKRDAAYEEAAGYERQAGETRASSQRQAIEERRQARLAESRSLALAAAGGGGASDATVVEGIADIAGEGEYNFLKAMYEGDTASDELKDRARMTRKAGKRALISSVLGAAGNVAGSTLQAKYG